MASRGVTRIATIAVALACSGLLGGCDTGAPSEPQPDLVRIDEQWTIDVPRGATVQDYFSSEVDFHGGRDDVFVLSIPSAERTELWDPATYSDGIPHDGAPSAAEIAESAGAPFTEEMYLELTCGDPTRADQNYLLICFHDADEEFYLFEQLF